MRAVVIAIVLCLLLQACGSKSGLVLPPKPDTERQQSNSGKQG